MVRVKQTGDVQHVIREHFEKHLEEGKEEEREGGRGEERERMNVTKRERKGGEANRQR